MVNLFSVSVKRLISIGVIFISAVCVLSCNSLQMHGFGKHGEILSLSPEDITLNSYNKNEIIKENFVAIFNSMERSRFRGSLGKKNSTEVEIRINEMSFEKKSTEMFQETFNSIIIEIEIFKGEVMSAGYTLIDTTAETLASPRYMEKVIKRIMEQLHG